MSTPSRRPLSRSLIKLGSRILLGGPRAHFQDAFPGLRLQSGASGSKVIYRGREQAVLFSPAILGHGQPVGYIVGSGPSVRQCDMTRVEDGTAILLNGAIHLTAAEIRKPLAVAIEDERFVWRHFDLMRERVSPGTICLLSVQVLRAICENDGGWLADKRVVLIDNLLKPYARPRRHPADFAGEDFVFRPEDATAAISLDPAKGVFQGGSVAISALQFLIACRPGLIGLFGIDISNADAPRFYETAGASAFSGIASAQARIVGYFDVARQFCQSHDIALECYSDRSALLGVGYRFSDRFSRAAGSQDLT